MDDERRTPDSVKGNLNGRDTTVSPTVVSVVGTVTTNPNPLVPWGGPEGREGQGLRRLLSRPTDRRTPLEWSGFRTNVAWCPRLVPVTTVTVPCASTGRVRTRTLALRGVVRPDPKVPPSSVGGSGPSCRVSPLTSFHPPSVHTSRNDEELHDP